MSDIRLSSITIDPQVNSLTIRNGSVNILNSLESNGSIKVSSTINSDNLTTGSITTLGGVSVLKDLRIGNSVHLDSVSGTFRVGGVSKDRLFVDTIANKEITFSPDGQTNAMIINDNGVQILPITPSTSGTAGALIVSGGISVKNSTAATSITAGGALTVRGGAAISKNLLVGETIYANSFLSDTAFDITGPGAQPIGGLEIQDNGGVGIYSSTDSYFTAPGFRFWNGSTSGIFLTIKDSNSSFSTNTNTISGTTTITNSTESSGITNGALSIRGGVGITKTLNVGNLLGISPNLDNSQKIVLWGSLTDPLTFTGLGSMSSGNLNLQVSNTMNDLILTTGASEIFRIKGSSKEIYIGGSFTSGSTQSYSLKNLSSDLAISGMSPGSGSNLSLFSANGDGTTPVSIKLFNKGTSSVVTNSEFLQLGSDTTNYFITPNGSGTGVIRNLILGDNLTINKSGSFVTVNSTRVSSNSTTAGLVVSGGLSVSSTVDSSNSTAGGALTIAGGVAIGKSLFVGNNLNVSGNITAGKVILGTSELYTSVNTLVIDTSQVSIRSTSLNVSNPFVTSGSYNSETRIYGLGTINSANGEWLELGTNNSSTGFSILTRSTGLGTNRSLNLGSAASFSGLGTSLLGTLSVNSTSTFGNNVLINGNLTVSSGGNLSLGLGTTITTGALMLTSTTDSSNLSTGALVLSGGLSVAKTARIGDTMYVKNTNWTSTNGSDIYFNANGDSIYLRPNSGSGLNQMVLTSSGTLNVTSTTDSSSGSTGAIITLGGLGVTKRAIIEGGITAGSSAFTSISSANVIITNNSVGVLTVSGSSTIGSNLVVNGTTSLGGISSIINSTESTDSSTGALVVSGGVGIRRNLNVGGDTILSGNLTVNGTTTTINSQNQLLKDNIFIMNSGPVGSRDSGFIIQRFQTANDSSSGDVVGDTSIENYTIGIQSGVTSSQIILPSSANNSNNYYNGWWIRIGSGFSAGQVRQITGYTGSTRLAQLATPFTSQNPANGDTVALYNKPYVGLVYRESSDLFSFTGVINDTSVSSTGLIGIESATVLSGIITTGSLIISSTVDSTNAGTGAVVMSGGMGINKSVTIGGDLTVNGVNITPNFGDIPKVQLFTGAQSASNASITGLVFNTAFTGAFDIFLMVRITATANRFASYHIRGIWKGGTSFEMVSSYVGDDLGISFGITTGGQITYSSPSYSGFVSMTMKFRAYTL